MYTTTEAAALLNVQPKTVSHYVKRGLITAEKRGRDYLIENAEIERFQRERRRPGKPRGERRRDMDTTSQVQEIIDQLNGVGNIDDYEAGVAAEKRLKQELAEMGYVARYSDPDGDGGTYTAIRAKDAQ